ncbi:hypothetical protein [Massilia sp. Leaf139]|uniref:hypothetical protein n=1 Tax=Massilia sp. Leaf139 TaxID=1736272 RepID=UPI0006F973FC|nr:hypothetical protein [Massilia sp. Leaf139]KQQ96148.1 hypothetical protein ASF77_21835 [Massilia sp. Leaf139]
MSRPFFRLPDDQARKIVQRVAVLDRDIPLDTNNHRPFVGAFIQAVHEATGSFYSPMIYQRLLRAYAPTRRPSTATIASERAHIMNTAEQLDRAAGVDDVQRERFAEAIRNVIADELDLRLTNLPAADISAGSAQVEFFKNRLVECEGELRGLRATAAQLVTDLALTRQRAEIADQELREQRQANEKLIEQLLVIQESADGNRKFALMAIDEVRGEVRRWKDRCAELELQRQQDFQQLDAMRRLVSERDIAKNKGFR